MSVSRITLPSAVSVRAKQRASERGCKSIEDYVRTLIEEDSPAPISAETERRLLESLSSPSHVATPRYWAEKRSRLRAAGRRTKAG
ncbi:MAG TPA: hypothetical protein VH518_23120 [Tepidisphaeraceae bacterium]|jgi:hypothetical protein